MALSIGPFLRRRWRTASRLPGGKWLFSRLLGLYVPYTGSIRANVETLEPGHCRVRLRKRRRVSNHLGSVHAMALCNLAEMATGLALLNGLPAGARGILGGFSIVYLKKARGLLNAECRCEVPADNRQQELELTGEIRDEAGDVVALAKARWLIGPEKDAAVGAAD